MKRRIVTVLDFFLGFDGSLTNSRRLVVRHLQVVSTDSRTGVLSIHYKGFLSREELAKLFRRSMFRLQRVFVGESREYSIKSEYYEKPGLHLRRTMLDHHWANDELLIGFKTRGGEKFTYTACRIAIMTLLALEFAPRLLIGERGIGLASGLRIRSVVQETQFYLEGKWVSMSAYLNKKFLNEQEIDKLAAKLEQ